MAAIYNNLANMSLSGSCGNSKESFLQKFNFEITNHFLSTVTEHFSTIFIL